MEIFHYSSHNYNNKTLVSPGTLFIDACDIISTCLTLPSLLPREPRRRAVEDDKT